MEKLKIILVDNELELIRNIEERLSIRDEDTVIFELLMSGKNEIEILKEIKAKYPDLHIIILTEQENIESGVEVIKEEVVDIIRKPVDFEKLMKKIEDAKNKRFLIIDKEG